MKIRNCILIGLVAGIAALAAVAQTTLDTPEPESTSLKPVKLMVVEAEARELKRQFFGRVAARRTVDLAFQVGGQIQKFPVTEGSQIDKGALVAELDLKPFELALEPLNHPYLRFQRLQHLYHSGYILRKNRRKIIVMSVSSKIAVKCP